MDFVDGSAEPAIDAILYATGYVYDFPFLRPADSQVESVDNRWALPWRLGSMLSRPAALLAHRALPFASGGSMAACHRLHFLVTLVCLSGPQAVSATACAACRVSSVWPCRVKPLFKHLLVPHWAPTLALLGLPFKVGLGFARLQLACQDARATCLCHGPAQ